MDMSSPVRALRSDRTRPVGGGTRTPDLGRTLAIHGARQRGSRMAALMRQGDPPCLKHDDPARMLAFYSDDTTLSAQQPWARGAFNITVAAILEGAK